MAEFSAKASAGRSTKKAVPVARGALDQFGFSGYSGQVPPPRGRHHFEERRGVEVKEKLHTKIQPKLPPVAQRAGGKRPLEAQNGENVLMRPSNKRYIKSTPGRADERLFGSVRRTLNEDGTAAAQRRGVELPLEKTMTIKRKVDPPANTGPTGYKGEKQAVLQANSGYFASIAKDNVHKEWIKDGQALSAVGDFSQRHAAFHEASKIMPFTVREREREHQRAIEEVAMLPKFKNNRPVLPPPPLAGEA